MSYTFRVVFSGPCAYVPNLVEGDCGPAKSWSVILPDLRKGWPGDNDGIQVDRHLPVLSYSPDDFECTDTPDTILKIKNPESGLYRQSNLFLLDGDRITFDLPGAKILTVENTPIPYALRADQEEIAKLKKEDPLLRSTDWLPAMSWLMPQLEWFGYYDPSNYFRPDDDEAPGYPVAGHVAAHVLLKQGTLITDQIDTVETKCGPKPTIWDLRPYGYEEMGIRQQAIAKSIALEVPMNDKPASITIAFKDSVKKTLTLKMDKLTGTRGIEIKNRELEEIFLDKGFESESQKIDLDFRYLYSHLANYKSYYLHYPLPYLHKGGDGTGNETATCGGNKPSGFAKSFSNLIKQW